MGGQPMSCVLVSYVDVVLYGCINMEQTFEKISFIQLLTPNRYNILDCVLCTMNNICYSAEDNTYFTIHVHIFRLLSSRYIQMLTAK